MYIMSVLKLFVKKTYITIFTQVLGSRSIENLKLDQI